jgi:RNA processing factor Prp31
MTNPFSLPPLPVAKGILGKIQMALTIKAMIEDKKKSAEAIKNAAVATALQKALEIKDKKIQELREKGEVVISEKKKSAQSRLESNVPNVPTSPRKRFPNINDIDKNPRIIQLQKEKAEIDAKAGLIAAQVRELSRVEFPDRAQISTKLVEYRALSNKSLGLLREISAERKRLIQEAYGT